MEGRECIHGIIRRLSTRVSCGRDVVEAVCRRRFPVVFVCGLCEDVADQAPGENSQKFGAQRAPAHGVNDHLLS